MAAPIGGAVLLNLPATSPSPGNLPTFNTNDGGLIGRAKSPEFDNTWGGSFNPVNEPDDTNKNGFKVDAPFYCLWAREVNSSMPAVSSKTPFHPLMKSAGL